MDLEVIGAAVAVVGTLLWIRRDLRHDMAALRGDMRHDMAALRHDMRQDMTALRTDLTAQIGAVATRIDNILLADRNRNA